MWTAGWRRGGIRSRMMREMWGHPHSTIITFYGVSDWRVILSPNQFMNWADKAVEKPTTFNDPNDPSTLICLRSFHAPSLPRLPHAHPLLSFLLVFSFFFLLCIEYWSFLFPLTYFVLSYHFRSLIFFISDLKNKYSSILQLQDQIMIAEYPITVV